MNLRSAVVSQFKRPRGILGRVVGWILASRGSNLARNRWTVDLLDPKSGERVLEIGCGPGVALELCLLRANVAVGGVDHSALMVSQARRRNSNAVREGRAVLVEGTIDDAPRDLAPFDKLFSINVIQFVDLADFAASARRLLKSGGVFAATYQPRHPKATRDDARAMAVRVNNVLRQSGFADMRIEEIDLKPVPAVCVLARAV